MIDRDGLAALVIELASLPGLPGREEAVAGYIRGFLGARGIGVVQDEAGQAFGSGVGNLHAAIPGRSSSPRLLFAAHLDAARPPSRPVLRDGVLRTGEGYFAADDRIGLALALALADFLCGEPPGCTVEFLFTVAEEAGMMGARRLPPSVLRADCAFVLDSPGPPGSLAIQGDAGQEFSLTIGGRRPRGRAAGPDARWVANRVLARLPVGAAGLGSVLELAPIRERPAEIAIAGAVYGPDRRPVQQIMELVRVLACETATRYGYCSRFQTGRSYPGYLLPLASAPVSLAVAAARHVLLKPAMVRQRWASDANILNALGLPAANLGAGWHEAPDGAVWAYLDELGKMMEFMTALVGLAATRPGWKERDGADDPLAPG